MNCFCVKGDAGAKKRGVLKTEEEWKTKKGAWKRGPTRPCWEFLVKNRGGGTGYLNRNELSRARHAIRRSKQRAVITERRKKPLTRQVGSLSIHWSFGRERLRCRGRGNKNRCKQFGLRSYQPHGGELLLANARDTPFRQGREVKEERRGGGKVRKPQASCWTESFKKGADLGKGGACSCLAVRFLLEEDKLLIEKSRERKRSLGKAVRRLSTKNVVGEGKISICKEEQKKEKEKIHSKSGIPELPGKENKEKGYLHYADRATSHRKRKESYYEKSKLMGRQSMMGKYPGFLKIGQKIEAGWRPSRRRVSRNLQKKKNNWGQKNFDNRRKQSSRCQEETEKKKNSENS